MIPKLQFGRDFQGILDYLVENRDHQLLDARGVSSLDAAPDEMALTAALSERARSVVAHASVSAALSDGVLPTATWLLILNAMEAELGLVGHQRIVVRHEDHDYDHIHVFWCTVSPETGQTPPKRWFLCKGAEIDGIGELALTAEQVESIPAEHRVRGSWNRRALMRMQQVARRLERELGLRQLRTPREMAAARVHGEQRPVQGDRQHREQRTGARTLLDQADAIRGALDSPNWSSARSALAKLGLAFEPAYRKRRDMEVVSGLVIYDPNDPASRIVASALDVAGRKYGLRQIEKRHEPGALSIDEWWPQRSAEPNTPDTAAATDPDRALREQFALERARHRIAERKKASERLELKARHRREARAVRARLMQDRQKAAQALPAALRKDFNARYSRSVRQPELEKLAERQKRERLTLRRTRFPTWLEYAAKTKPRTRPSTINRIAELPRTVTDLGFKEFADRKTRERIDREAEERDNAAIGQSIARTRSSGPTR